MLNGATGKRKAVVDRFPNTWHISGSAGTPNVSNAKCAYLCTGFRLGYILLLHADQKDNTATFAGLRLRCRL